MSQPAPNIYLEFHQRYRNDRVAFVRNVLGADPDPWQEKVLKALDRGERRITVRSGHGVGKSALGAWISTHALCCYVLAKVVMTAPSGPQLWDALYAETKMWFNRLPEALRCLFRLGVDRIEALAAPEQLFVSARTSRAESPEALQGVHAEGGIVIILCDEASGIPDTVFEAGAGSMSGENCHTILFSNPTRITGFFFDTFHKLKERWFRLHVSCVNSKRVSKDYLDDMAARYGLESNQYRVRVLGEFPIRDDSTWIALELVTEAMVRDIVLDTLHKPKWGVDVARFGNDISVICKRRGKVVYEQPKEYRRFDTMQLVGAVIWEWNNTEEADRPDEINVDVIGIGAGVVDRLLEQGLPARGINVSESPAFDPTGQYNKLRDELWGKGRAWLEARDCKLPDSEDLYELAVPRYAYQSNGKLKIESKDEMRKRGVPSPNYADAFLLTLAGEVVSGGAVGASNWKKPLPRRKIGVV